jgi:hypothetical protein
MGDKYEIKFIGTYAVKDQYVTNTKKLELQRRINNFTKKQ